MKPRKRPLLKNLPPGKVSTFMADAPVNLVIVGKKDVWDMPFDTSAAIENILLMVTALGLGACWVIAPCIDIRDEERMKALLGIPEGFKAISIFSIGHPTRPHRPRPRMPIKDLVFSEKWGEHLLRGGSMNNKMLPLDYANSLMFEMEKAFWDERGKGARFRMTTVGREFYKAKFCHY